MGDEENAPLDPLTFIQQCLQVRRIYWTHHVNMRMKDRVITRSMILENVADYEIIEAYPEDKYLPTYLVMTRHGGKAIHVLFATDTEEDNVRVVTAYSPSPDEWNPDMKTRKTP